MGTVLEALWGYFVNETWEGLKGGPPDCELAWIVGHQYSDFACVSRTDPWDFTTRAGEYFRIEAKSMNLGADESKGHFDEIHEKIAQLDQLLVLVWQWTTLDDVRVYPQVADSFLGEARSVALLRDELHMARGGTFVNSNECPDGCAIASCTHGGEPLNADGKRERRGGPETRRGSVNVPNAANFGGLVRMLKTTADSRSKLREVRAADPIADQYVAFIHQNFPDEERNHYRVAEWRATAEKLGLDVKGLKRDEVVTAVRGAPDYRRALRSLQ